jgi:hypothetical protein
LEGGPPIFRQDFPCPALLWDRSAGVPYGAVTRSGPSFQTLPVPNPATAGLVRFRSPLLAESRLMSFPPATEMFQFAGFASLPYGFRQGYPPSCPGRVGCPIRRSRDHRSLASPPGFSQRAASFIASQCQGIHQMPLSCSDPLRTAGPASRRPAIVTGPPACPKAGPPPVPPRPAPSPAGPPAPAQRAEPKAPARGDTAAQPFPEDTSRTGYHTRLDTGTVTRPPRSHSQTRFTRFNQHRPRPARQPMPPGPPAGKTVISRMPSLEDRRPATR